MMFEMTSLILVSDIASSIELDWKNQEDRTKSEANG